MSLGCKMNMTLVFYALDARRSFDRQRGSMSSHIQCAETLFPNLVPSFERNSIVSKLPRFLLQSPSGRYT